MLRYTSLIQDAPCTNLILHAGKHSTGCREIISAYPIQHLSAEQLGNPYWNEEYLTGGHNVS